MKTKILNVKEVWNLCIIEGGNRSSSRKNLIYGVVIVVLVALLGCSSVDEDKKSAELQALNKKLYQEKQEKQAALK